MKLFDVSKMPLYCEGIAHRIETRKSGDVKVVDLTLKIDPFTAQLASALDQTEHGGVKRKLFKINDGTPDRDLRSAEFKIPHDRQKLICYASPDTVKASIALDQVKVSQMRVRGMKDGDGWVFYLKASFGPLSRAELEYVNAWYTEQRFVTFEEAEASLDFEQDDEDEETPAMPPPTMLDATAAGEPVPVSTAADEPARQRLHTHAGGKGAKSSVAH